MGIYIADQILKSANRCEKGKRCIDRDTSKLCKIDYCASGKVLFVKCLDNNFCAYQDTFGDGIFCDCPVRKEIYNQYKM